MNIDQFLTGFPEFGDTDANLVDAKLREAALEINTDPTYGFGAFSAAGTDPSLADSAHGYLTAHKLALSPMGQNARMIPKDGVTTYLRHFQDLVRKTIPGASVS